MMNGMNDMGGMMGGMWLIGGLVIIVLLLLAAALIKYLFSGSGRDQGKPQAGARIERGDRQDQP